MTGTERVTTSSLSVPALCGGFAVNSSFIDPGDCLTVMEANIHTQFSRTNIVDVELLRWVSEKHFDLLWIQAESQFSSSGENKWLNFMVISPSGSV